MPQKTTACSTWNGVETDQFDAVTGSNIPNYISFAPII